MTLSVLTGEPPKDGEVYAGIYCKNVRWKAYKKGAPQLKRGIKGRWQELTEYGGWQNCDTPGMYSYLISIDPKKKIQFSLTKTYSHQSEAQVDIVNVYATASQAIKARDEAQAGDEFSIYSVEVDYAD